MRHRRDDPHARLSTAEVMSVPLVATTFFDGNIDKARLFLHEYGYMPRMISKSHLNRRIHAVEHTLWQVLFRAFGPSLQGAKRPRISDVRGGLSTGAGVQQHPYPPLPNLPFSEEGHDDDGTPKKKSFRGYIASKRRYFYGLRVHSVVTGAGEPVEFSLAAGSEADVAAFKDLDLDLPEGSIICAYSRRTPTTRICSKRSACT